MKSLRILITALLLVSLMAPGLAQTREYQSTEEDSRYSDVLYEGYQRFSQYEMVQAGTANESKLAVDIYRPTKNGVLVTNPLPEIWQHQLGRATWRDGRFNVFSGRQ